MDTMFLRMTVKHMLNEGNLDPAELVMILRGIADEIEAESDEVVEDDIQDEDLDETIDVSDEDEE